MTMNAKPTVAVLGTGIMGAGMTRSLVRAGHPVRVWNRTPERAEPLAADGAIVAASPAEAVSGADAVITILFDTDAVLSVIGDLATGGVPLPLWLQSSTIGVDGTKQVAGLAAQRGLDLVDAPVLGTRQPAEQGKLVVLASGPTDLVERAQPVFDAIGSRTLVAGDRVGDASALKLACNSWVATLNAAVGQAIALTGALGLDPALFLQAIEGSPTDSPYAQLKGKQMIDGNFPTAFAVDGVVKDLGLITAAARASGVSDDLLAAATGLYQRAGKAGHGNDDMAAVVTALRAATPSSNHEKARGE